MVGCAWLGSVVVVMIRFFFLPAVRAKVIFNTVLADGLPAVLAVDLATAADVVITGRAGI